MWIKNSKGSPDAMLTCAVLGLGVVFFCLIGPMFSGFRVPWTDYVINLTPPDNSLVISVLAATFTSYVVRRNKSDQLESDEKNGVVR